MAGLTRKIAKLFGGNYQGAPTNQIAQFGSLKAGAAAYSADPAVIQSLAAWLNGWTGAVVTVGGNPNVPPLQDVNAVEFVLSYQIAYLLTRGIPEWEVGTTYNQYDICRKNGVIYESRADANTGHDPASDHANWASQGLAAGVANSGQTLTVDGTGHIVEFDTEAFDTDAAFDPATFKFTAPTAGLYQVSAVVQVDNVDASLTLTEFSMRIVKNGATGLISNGTNTPNPAGARWYPSVAGLVQLAAGDTLEIQLSATDGVGTHTVTLSNGNLSVQRTRAV